MMAPANNDGAGSLTSCPGRRQLKRSDNQPRTWQPAPIPCNGRRKVRDYNWLPCTGHASTLQFVQIGSQQLQAMSGVAKKIALHQDIGNRVGLLCIKSRAGEQVAGKGDQISSRITHGSQRGAPTMSFFKRTSCGAR
jgi:hypothetical protein